MGLYKYLLEVVVPSVSFRKLVIPDPKELKIEIESRLAQFSLTSSRLNLTTFCGENTATLEADSETIVDDLKNNPLKVIVKLKEQIVGTGEIPWPKKFVDGIGENMEVITDGANTELKMDDKVVGCVEVILRLQGCCNKCELQEEEANENDFEDNYLTPGDIMFLMDDGEGCKKKEPEAPEDPCPNRLNLSNYRESNGKIMIAPEFNNACTSPQCIGLKKMGGDLEQVVKSLVCSGLQDVRANKKPQCCNPCELKLDPCTGKYVCPKEQCCCFCQKDDITTPCCFKSKQYVTCGPQTCVVKPCCAPIPVCGMPNSTTVPSSLPSTKCVSCMPCSPSTAQKINTCLMCQKCVSCMPCSPPPAEKINTCVMCQKYEYLPKEWPNLPQVECRCSSITPKPKTSKSCRICQDLIKCLNTQTKQKGDQIIYKPLVREPKYCRFCNCDISWLPKNYPCPTCGDKQKSCLQQEYKKTLKMIRKLMDNEKPKC